MENLSRRDWMTTTSAMLLASTANVGSAQTPPVPVPEPISSGKDLFDCVETHFDRLIHYSLDRFGSTRSGMWMASIDLETNELARSSGDEAVLDRQYIPGAFWYADQPLLVAAGAVATRSACKCYADAVDQYVRSYLHFAGTQRSLNDHRRLYWDAARDELLRLPALTRTSFSHTPAWETLWRFDRELTRRMIREVGTDVLKNKDPSISDSIVAMESLRWLMHEEQTTEGADLQLIQRISEWMLSKRQPVAQFSPTEVPWQACRFAACCLRIAKDFQLTDLRDVGVKYSELLLTAFASSPRYPNTESDGKPCSLNESSVQFAQQCLEFFTLSKSHDSETLTTRFANHLTKCDSDLSNPKRNAEGYGRAIYFLHSASKALDRRDLGDAANRLAEVAVEKLFSSESGMFRSRTGANRCDAADGIGYLMLALLAIDGEDPTRNSAFSF